MLPLSAKTTPTLHLDKFMLDLLDSVSDIVRIAVSCDSHCFVECIRGSVGEVEWKRYDVVCGGREINHRWTHRAPDDVLLDDQ